jgi:hypothetical protein
MLSPDIVIKRAQKLRRRESYLTLLNAIRTHPLSHSERIALLERIMAATVSEAITPSESRKLTKGL